MNPLDPQELQPFLRKLNEEMPIHTDKTAKIKRSYSQGMPKNLMEYSAHIDNKFLNDNLAIIEEIRHRDLRHPIPKWFREYQLKHYSKYGILNHDGFFAPGAVLKNRRGLYPYVNLIGLGGGSTKVFGSELEGLGPFDTDGGSSNGQITATKLNNGVIGHFYDQIAMKVGATSAGNIRLGCYDDNAVDPNNLYSETGSIAAPGATTYVFQSVNEFELASVLNWAAFQQNDASHTGRRSALSDASRIKAQGFGAFANPLTGESVQNHTWQLKIGHSQA